MERQNIDWERMSQVTYLPEDLYPQYIKNTQALIMSNWTTQFKNGPKIWTDTSPRMVGGQERRSTWNYVST